MVSPELVAVGDRLGKRLFVLLGAEIALFIGMTGVFVRDLGGWRHVLHVGILNALAEYFMRPLSAMFHSSAGATQQAWTTTYVMMGLFLCMAIVGLLLQRVATDLQRYRRFRQQREWEGL